MPTPVAVVSEAPPTVNPLGYMVDYGLDGGITSLVPILPGMAYSGRGAGIHNLDNRVGGTRGTLEVFFTPITPPGEVLLAALVTTINGTLSAVKISLTAGMQPRCTISDVRGTTILAANTAFMPTLTEGIPAIVRVSWDAARGTATVRVNGTPVLATAYTSSPAAPWTPAAPAYMVITDLLPGFTDFFMGTFSRANVGNVSL